MSLFELTYSQASLAAMLEKSGINETSLDLVPWTGDSIAILDNTGNMLGYVTNNVVGGQTISDVSLRPLASSISITEHEKLLFDGGMGYIGISQPNILGGEFVSNPEGKLTLSSINNQFSNLVYNGNSEQIASATYQNNSMHIQNLLGSNSDQLLDHDVNDLILSGFDNDLFGVFELFDLL